MKVFAVSDACTGCGECTVRTSLLTEDSHGFAVPMPGRFIQETDLPDAEKIVSQCPANALSIVERSSVVSRGKAGLEELAQVLKDRLAAVDIPDIEISDIAYRKEDYHVDYGYVKGEMCYNYSSERAARNAGQTQFERVFWNRRPDFVISILTQYKSKMLRKYFDLSNPVQTYYGEIGRQMESILKDIMAEASSLIGRELPVSAGFTSFHPEREDRDFKKDVEEEYDEWSVSTSYVKSFCDGFERMEYHRKRDYEDYICVDSDEIIEFDSRFREKRRSIYCFKGVYEEGRDLVNDILDYLYLAESCGLRCIDDIYTDKINYFLDRYRKLVEAEIAKKVDEFKDAISKC